MFDPSSIFNPFANAQVPLWLILVVMLWTLVWKGFALWKAASKKQPIWFILFLVVNTLGIIEIMYLFLFSKIKLDAKSQTHKAKRGKR